jgi:integrase
MARRGQGEGTFRQRSDGTWEARVRLADGTRKSIYGKTRKIVSDRLTQIQTDQRKGLPVVAEKETTGDYLTRWLTDTAKHTVRPSTFESYERLVRKHVIPHIGKVKLARLSAQDLSRLYSSLLDQGLSPRTVQYVHAIIHRALKQALRWSLVARNVAELVDAPRPVRKEIRPLSTEQSVRFLEATESDRMHALYVVALTTGMRQAELLGLRWADLDWSRGAIAVRQQAIRTKATGMVFTEPKTAKGKRSIALPGIALDALRAHRIRQNEERLALGSVWADNDLVFPSETGTPIERQNLMRRSFWPALDRAGLPRIRFHDLRHTAATLMLSQGVHPKVVQERLGHTTIGVTLDVYSHVLPDMQAEAADKLDQVFGWG